ncbi:sulfurtransferase [Microbacterium terricola]|uniref:Sulfurtransferase n=1 Tax=Microbacterium terricola TaxID=344163 RepID=A0ABM8E004_9MICO|nr:rhodanese-like domain-containing protein [Microbacterium terricola]UYK41062.1 rhodanese-like domain-containing protein [Microbacterium terricola]BDV31179.1 sulfurtransferase [Microbacterium terricola]
MTQVFVSAAELRTELDGPTPPTVFDATLILRRPRFDGDFTATSGRPRWATAHLPGSRHVAIDTDFSVPHVTHDHHPEPQQIADRLADLGVGPHDRVVAYDTAGGLWAARLWYLLDGIDVDVRVLDGGLAAWRDAGGAVVESDEPPAAAPAERWTAHARRPAWIDRDEVLGALPTANLVCGLSRASFAGAEPTRYTRRGHIPGSANVPARELFDEAGLVRTPAAVRAAFTAAGVDLDREVLLYCGGGISATANALALRHAGVSDVRVYDGSLEEWSADPSLPLVLTAEVSAVVG